jgi:hypothetical protein
MNMNGASGYLLRFARMWVLFCQDLRVLDRTVSRQTKAGSGTVIINERGFVKRARTEPEPAS